MKRKTFSECMALVIGHTAANQHRNKEFQLVGYGMGATYTNHGLPIDMAMSKLREINPELSDLDCAVILQYALEHLVTHKRNSGATDKAIERQRKTNANALVSFMNKGETGIDV